MCRSILKNNISQTLSAVGVSEAVAGEEAVEVKSGYAVSRPVNVSDDTGDYL